MAINVVCSNLMDSDWLSAFIVLIIILKVISSNINLYIVIIIVRSVDFVIHIN